MKYRGTVHGDVVVLGPGARLPDGLEVEIVPLRAEEAGLGADSYPLEMRNGVPVFPQCGSGVAADLELVNRLRDETP